MHMNHAYLVPSTVWIPYEMKKVFGRILHELQYLDRQHPHHFTLNLDKLDRIFECRVTSIELKHEATGALPPNEDILPIIAPSKNMGIETKKAII